MSHLKPVFFVFWVNVSWRSAWLWDDCFTTATAILIYFILLHELGRWSSSVEPVFRRYLRRLVVATGRTLQSAPHSPMASQINTTQLSFPICGLWKRSHGTYRVIAFDEVFIRIY